MSIPRQRAIIDRRRLIDHLDAILADRKLTTEAARRSAVLAAMKQALADGRAEIRRRFFASRSIARGDECTEAYCFLIDQLIHILHDFAADHVHPPTDPARPGRLCIAAVGGYGRGDLAPYSDLDLLFLTAVAPSPRMTALIEYVLYMLWDLGLQVGHSTRSVAECLRQAQADHTVRTALLEARFIWGDQPLFRRLKHEYAQYAQASASAFVEAKLAERDARHLKHGDSRYVLEPDIKDGKGGLRDLHSMYWIAKDLFRVESVEELVLRGYLTQPEARTFHKAASFLVTLRCHLHFLAGRPEERLTFDVQPTLARQMGYTDRAGAPAVERFMKHYFLIAKDVGDLTRIFCAAFEAAHKKRPLFRLPRFDTWRARLSQLGDFKLDGDRLSVAADDVFLTDPVNFLRLFRLYQQYGIDIHPHALRLIRRDLRRIDETLRDNPEANALFLEILTERKDPARTLRLMSEAGVLGRFIPDFGRVTAQMQYDMYHVHTTDEHTINCVGNLARIEAGELEDEHPIASEVVHKVLSRRVLYLATLLHDIAKGRRGDHSVLGEKVARRLCPRLGLSDEETDNVAWLVRYHLLASYAAFKRDVDDPKTIADFCAIVQSPERLRLLLVLTVVDIRSVGPKVWTPWKATLLRELYVKADELLSGGLSAEREKTARVAAAQEAVRAKLADWSDDQFAAFTALCNDQYWLALDADNQARHARLVAATDEASDPFMLSCYVDRAKGVTEVSVYTTDHPGLLSRLAGALAIAGANIVDAKLFTMTNSMALDTFYVQDITGAPVEQSDRVARIQKKVRAVLAGEIVPHRELRKASPLLTRTKVFTVAPRVLFDNKASATYTVIEVNGRDRRGLLYDLTRALTACNLSIATAKISTFGESVIDVFYVRNLFGMKVTEESHQAKIRAALLRALTEEDEADETTAPSARPAAGQAHQAAE